MAMPTATLAMLSCPGSVACTSISAAACGTTTGPKTITALAAAAGKALPINMTSCWYGYDDSLKITPVTFSSISNAGATCVITACAPAFNTFTASCGANTWLHPAAPSAPSPTGVAQNIVIDTNAGVARTGCACYTPVCGGVCCVSISQLAGVTWKCVYIGSVGGTGCGGSLTTTCQCGVLAYTPSLSAGECYCGCFGLGNSVTVGNGGGADGYVICNGTVLLHCCTTAACGTGNVSFVVKFGDSVCLCAIAHTPSSTCTGCACSNVCMCIITSIVGGECYGGGCCVVSTFTG